jgi:leucyl-tRNA synthetase
MARFAKRLWNLLANHNDIIVISPDETAALIAKTHKTIRKVTEDIKIYHYNTAIAVIMELVNKMYEIINNGNVKRANGGLPRGERKRALRGIRCAEWDFTINALTKMLAPFTPHLAEEVWREVLGNRDSVHISAWPVYSEELVKEEYINIPVQVNGRLRAKIKIAADSANDKDEVERQAMEDENVKKWIEGKDYKVIFVPGRLINFVVR